MDPAVRLFTVSEADQLLDQIVPLVKKLQTLQQAITRAHQQLDDAQAKLSHGNGYPIQEIRRQVGTLTERQVELAEEFTDALSELESTGCVLKDVNLGLIDFHHLRDAEVVFLCWKLGEEQIRFWHGLADGYAGRRPL